jgi:enoyl-CoA hydratase
MRNNVFFDDQDVFMSDALILTEKNGAVFVITLNRPNAMNALCTPLMQALKDALQQAQQDDTIKVLVIMGSEKAFAAGADIAEMKEKTYIEAYKENYITNAWEALATCRKPVIAAVRGFALGGGAELTMMCDIVLASPTAKFGQPEVNLGILPGAGATQRLGKSVGKAKAMDWCLTGRMISAEEAERAGLVSQILPEETFVDDVMKVAQTLAKKSLPSLMMIKEAVLASFETPLAQGITFERRLFHAVFATHDQKEGMAAFLEKRKPEFKDA